MNILEIVKTLSTEHQATLAPYLEDYADPNTALWLEDPDYLLECAEREESDGRQATADALRTLEMALTRAQLS